eukprot:3895386-Prymnesium_polylepis.2
MRRESLPRSPNAASARAPLVSPTGLPHSRRPLSPPCANPQHRTRRRDCALMCACPCCSALRHDHIREHCAQLTGTGYPKGCSPTPSQKFL